MESLALEVNMSESTMVRMLVMMGMDSKGIHVVEVHNKEILIVGV